MLYGTVVTGLAEGLVLEAWFLLHSTRLLRRCRRAGRYEILNGDGETEKTARVP